jgi:hypothetical protein
MPTQSIEFILFASQTPQFHCHAHPDLNGTWRSTFLIKTISSKNRVMSCFPLMPTRYTKLLLGLHALDKYSAEVPSQQAQAMVGFKRPAGKQLTGEHDVHPIVSGIHHRIDRCDDTVSERESLPWAPYSSTKDKSALISVDLDG